MLPISTATKAGTVLASGSGDEAQRQQDAARLAALEGKLAKMRPGETSASNVWGEKFSQANIAWRMVIELVAGLMLGFGIGYGLDWLLGTRPFLLVLFVLAGMAAGVKTMMRTAAELGGAPPPASASAAQEQAGGHTADDDDDEDEGH